MRIWHRTCCSCILCCETRKLIPLTTILKPAPSGFLITQTGQTPVFFRLSIPLQYIRPAYSLPAYGANFPQLRKRSFNMDIPQLQTIVVTAAISIVAKELITWLVSIIKTLLLKSTLTAKLKIIFNKTNRAIMWDCLMLIFNITFLIIYVNSPEPLTKLSVIVIIGLILIILILLVTLLWDIYKASVERESRRQFRPE